MRNGCRLFNVSLRLYIHVLNKLSMRCTFYGRFSIEYLLVPSQSRRGSRSTLESATSLQVFEGFKDTNLESAGYALSARGLEDKWLTRRIVTSSPLPRKQRP